MRRAVVDGGRVIVRRVTRSELPEVGAFRLRVYSNADNNYLLSSLDRDGLDALDARSFVYAAFLDGALVGTLRATPAPFEVERYLPGAVLRAELGGALERYLEVSRMLVEPALAGLGLGTAMVGYAGVDVLSHTRYRGYLAYVRLPPDDRTTTVRFRIPERGAHDYTLVSGSIGFDALWRGVGRVRRARRPAAAASVSARPAARAPATFAPPSTRRSSSGSSPSSPPAPSAAAPPSPLEPSW